MKKSLSIFFALMTAFAIISAGCSVGSGDGHNNNNNNNTLNMDVKWIQSGVRVWYFGAAGLGMSSNAVEAFLFGPVSGNNIQVTKHSGIQYWSSHNPPEVNSYSRIEQGPCWIHPQVLQNIKAGDRWMGIEIQTMNRSTHTYNTFKNNQEFASVPYLLLPIKALFDHKNQREIVKLVYGMPYIDNVWGTAYFDAYTGLCLFNLKSSVSTVVFLLLSEINYDFANQRAFAEDNGPHTGFMSTAVKTSTPSNLIDIKAYVESRYGRTIQMWTSTQSGGSTGYKLPENENYCFFGSVPVVKRKLMTATPYYPPEQWNEYGQYLWWWVPTDALQKSAINVFNVSMDRTPGTNIFTASAGAAGLYFSRLEFDNDGYMTSFCAADPSIGLDCCAGYIIDNIIRVDGLEYYKTTMGTAIPSGNPGIDY
jgi:hypothetical protein